jgi:type VI secretion system protein VasG
VVLLDECEKADLEVMNLFYQVFDKGCLTDGEGREVDFKNTLLVLTSNLGAGQVMAMHEGGARPGAEEVAAAIRPALSRHFKPALLARMTVVPFAPLGEEALREVVELKLAVLERRLEETHGIRTSFSLELKGALAARCTEPETGARAVDHVLRGSLMPALSRALLEKMSEGEAVSKLTVGVAADGGFAIELGGVGGTEP